MAARVQGVAPEKRLAVLTGALSVDDARAERLAGKEREEAEPIPLGTKAEVLAFLGRVAGQLMVEMPTGWASSAAAIAGQALKAQGVDEKSETPTEEVGAFEYRVVGRSVAS